ncbi:MAG: S8 family serine peptidase [Acidobacteria bacterium]|nr:S8 family serine peptidase [Acidobacteriota bacterium]
MDDKVGETLRARLQTAQEYDTFDVNIFLEGEPAEAAARGAGEADFADAAVDVAADVASALQEHAAAKQQGLLGYLSEAGTTDAFVDAEVSVPQVRKLQSFWINNAVGAEVSRDVLEGILSRPDVIHVELTKRADISELADASKKSAKGGGGRKGPKKDGVKGGAKGAARGPRARRAGADAEDEADYDVGGRFNALDFVRSGLTFERFAETEDADAALPTWGVQQVKAPLLWQLGINGDGVVTAVIDTGVNYDHPDLSGRMWDGGAEFPNHGFDFASEDKDPRDEGARGFGHGTFCAGIVAGDGTSGKQTGVAPRARIMALRVGGQERNFWRALEFAVEHRAHVISMSMTWKFDTNPNYPGWRRVCEAVLAAGILHANSSGNQGNNTTDYPIPFNIGAPGNCPPPRLHPLQLDPGGGTANLSSPISCGATDQGDRLANFSGRGPCAWEKPPYTDYPFQSGAKPGLIKPDVCAPGVGITSCNWRFAESGNAYDTADGTSFSTPTVAGCLALLAHACLRSGNPVVPARVQEALENTAVRIQGQTRDKEIHYGAGRIDVFAAFKYGQSRGWWN